MPVYDLGDVARLKAQFHRIVGCSKIETDPTSVTVRVKDPHGAVTVYVYQANPEVVRDNVGRFHLDQPASAVGLWLYRWEGTGEVVAAGESSFEVRASDFACASG